MKRLLLALFLLIALLAGVFLWLGTPNRPAATAGSAPAPMAPAPAAPGMADAPAPVPARPMPAAEGARPPNDRFIVCPGNARCPPRQSTH
jgi:hypothetical protein